MSAKSLSVVARWRPLVESEAEAVEISRTTSQPTVDKKGRPQLYSVSIERKADPITTTSARNKPQSWSSPAAFQAVFHPDDDNQRLFDAVVAPAVPHILQGGRSSVFAYGHTGSGKTHTIFGYDDKALGLCLLAAQKLFAAITAWNASNNETTVGLGFRLFEMRKKLAVDLLDGQKECHVREGADGRVHIRGETQVLDGGKVRVCPIVQTCCWTYGSFIQALADALARRAVGSSSVHQQSSRTHAILELEIVSAALVAAREAVVDRQSELVPVGKRATDIFIEEHTKGLVPTPGGGWAPNPDYTVNMERINAAEAEKSEFEARVVKAEAHVDDLIASRAAPGLGGKMVFVDLAGAEYHQDAASSRQTAVRQTPQERQEAQQINTDLLALKEVMRAWSSSQPRIPFRSSALTMVLREHFVAAGDGHSAMIVTLSPSDDQYAATLNSLKYSSLVGVAKA